MLNNVERLKKGLQIKEIYKLVGAIVKNLHHDRIYYNIEFLCIERVNGEKEYIDLRAMTDITHAIVGYGDENAYIEIIDEGIIIRDMPEENLVILYALGKPRS